MECNITARQEKYKIIINGNTTGAADYLIGVHNSDDNAHPYIQGVLAGKQDTISDIENIRSGAALGATALQPTDLATVATTGSYNDLIDKPVIPTDNSQLTNGAGYQTASDVQSAISSKQDALTTAQLNAVNSGIDSTKVEQIGTNTSNIAGLQTGKQDTLTAGSNITISSNTISATDTTYSAFTGADGTNAGSTGLVPAPTATDNTKYLKGDGTWAAVDSLPSQTGHSGEFLTTDGTDASWAAVPTGLTNTATGSNALTILGTAGDKASSINIGAYSSVSSSNATVIGTSSSAYSYGTALGYYARALKYGATAVGESSYANGEFAVQIGPGTNSTDHTLSVGLDSSSNYTLLNSSGKIPTDRIPIDNSTITVSNGVLVAAGGGGGAPTLTWYTGNTGTSVTILDTSSATLVKVYKNGLLLEPTADYSVSGTALTLTVALVSTDKITVEVF